MNHATENAAYQPGRQAAAGQPTSAAVWALALSPLLFLFPSDLWSIPGCVVLCLVILDLHVLLKKNGHVDSNRLLAKHGYSVRSMRLWAVLVPPVYMFKRARLLGQKQIHWIIWVLAFALSLIIGIATSGGGDNDAPAVQAVKTATVADYPDATLGEMLDNYMSNTKWASLRASDGQTYVNVKGGASFGGKPVKVLLQYRLDDDGGSELKAFEIDGQPQALLRYIGFIEKAHEMWQQRRQEAAPGPQSQSKAKAPGGSEAAGSPDQAGAKGEEPHAAARAVSVGAIQREYSDNEVAADMQYKGKRLKLSSTVEEIGKHYNGQIKITLPHFSDDYSSRRFPTHAYFVRLSDETTIAQLRKGQRIEFMGTIGGIESYELQILECELL